MLVDLIVALFVLTNLWDGPISCNEDWSMCSTDNYAVIVPNEWAENTTRSHCGWDYPNDRTIVCAFRQAHGSGLFDSPRWPELFAQKFPVYWYGVFPIIPTNSNVAMSGQ